MNEFPYIQFMGNSMTCRDLAKQIHQNFEHIYMNGVDEGEADARPSVFFNKKKAILLIVERDFDLNSALCHHTSYWSELYDQLDGPGTATFQTKETIDASGNVVKPIPINMFNEKDDYWQEIKSLTITEGKKYMTKFQNEQI